MHQLQIYYTQKPFSGFQWRVFKKGELQILDKEFRIVLEDQAVLKIHAIDILEHMKMDGDFSKNWVRFRLLDGKEFYVIKKVLLPGIGGIFGGNKELYNQLLRFKI